MSKPVCPICQTSYKRGVKFCPNDGAALTLTPGAGEAGKTLAGRYAIMSKLGTGGMGVVYKARQITTGRVVAVKVISKKRTADPEIAARFQREMRIQSKLEHPNIVSIYDFDKTDEGQFFIVMPFVDGKPLEDLSTEMGPMELSVLVEIACQALDGLEYAHRKGIIHRDLKAENIIVSELEGKIAALILDFGIAKAMDADPDASSLAGAHLTRDGLILGTPSYMSPEQAKGETRELGPESDIYSMGVILYQMATADLPFKASSPFSLLNMHINEKPPKPSEKYPKINKTLETVIMRCLKKEPDKRYPSAEKLKEALQALAPKNAKAKTNATMATLAIIRERREETDEMEVAPARPLAARLWRAVKLAMAAALLAMAVAGYYAWSAGALERGADGLPLILSKIGLAGGGNP